MTLLILCLLAWIAVRSDDRRFWPLAIFTVPAIVFNVLSPYTGWWHYHLGATLDLCVLVALSRLSHVNGLTKLLAGVTLYSIYLNIAGYVMYELYMEPYVYDMAFNILYSITIVMVLLNGRFDRNSESFGVARSIRFSGGFG